MSARDPLAVVGGWVCRGLMEVSDDPADLADGGRWVVMITFEGQATLARFATWERRSAAPDEMGPWVGPAASDWVSTMDRDVYCASVAAIRAHIERGEVYQANLCRVLRAPIAPECDIIALHALLAERNPAPLAGALRLPEPGVLVASASPELYLRRRGRRVESSPIKGTGVTRADLLPKDEAENIMIVDLVRNDLGRVCEIGSVQVPALLEVEEHPGLVHLVSTVAGDLSGSVTWPGLLAATFPPGSVSGAPKLAALRIISELEPGPRGPYCGAFGWVDADRDEAELAVAIRTFWVEPGLDGPVLAFGTGAGITWSSDPGAEWRETQLKAANLLRAAGRDWGSG